MLSHDASCVFTVHGEEDRTYELLYFVCEETHRVLFPLHLIFGVLRHKGGNFDATCSDPMSDASKAFGEDFDHASHKMVVEYPKETPLPNEQYVLTPSEVRAERRSNCELCELH